MRIRYRQVEVWFIRAIIDLAEVTSAETGSHGGTVVRCSYRSIVTYEAVDFFGAVLSILSELGSLLTSATLKSIGPYCSLNQ